MSGLTEVAIVGAGPYGMSIAAHLRRHGVDYRIFGQPMQNWRTRMPRGMLLKSDGFASNLIAPDGEMTLADYCAARGIPYADEGIPVASENFIAYGEAFQARFVPDVDPRRVVAVARPGERFSVELDDGEVIGAAKVIVAIGISDFPFVPPHLSQLPAEYLSHASHHAAMDEFKGREVAIIGSGSSAIDIAALMHENGASVQVIARRPKLRFHTRTELGAKRTWYERARWPNTGIGPGWDSLFYTRAPQWFRHLPEAKRLGIVATSHGPAGGWYMADRIHGKVSVTEGFAPQSAEMRDGRIQLLLAGAGGEQKTISADHAIACTGYRVDLRKVEFLDDRLRGAVASVINTPVLSSHFESSVPGLYFVGPAAANTFGPMFRFVFGAEFAVPRVAAHLLRSFARRSVSMRPALATR
jgi:FAD-dependent urate hydroxylase